jgi:hypothetical protein
MSPQPPIDFNTRVGQYVKLRDKIKEIKEAHKLQLAPYVETLEQLNGILLDHLNQISADSTVTASGTVYRTEKKSASIADADVFWGWVVQHKDVRDYIDIKANVTAVEEHIKAMEKLAQSDPTIVPSAPPGVNWSSRYEVGVRRK